MSAIEWGANRAHRSGEVAGPEVEYPPTHYSPPPGASRLLLIRHALPVSYRPQGPREQLDGQDDPPLSDEGQEQAEQLARLLAHDGVGAVYASPLQRALQTADPLASALRVRPVVIPDLREVHLGEWEGGLVHQHLNQRDPLWEEVRERERWDAIPGAEANESLRERVRWALTSIHCRHPDQLVAVFTHDGVIAAALALATGSRPFAFSSAAHCSTSELVIEDEGRWRLRSFNSTEHLTPGRPERR